MWPKSQGISPVRRRNGLVLRGALVCVFGILAYFSLADTLANVVVRIDPARANALSFRNGQIAAELAEQEFTLEPDASAGSSAAQIARKALLWDATAAPAITVLGLQAQLRGERESAKALFAYSRLLSRRELRPNLWAIEDSVARGDIASAMESYDFALRTSVNARELLYPVLAGAISESPVREELIGVLAGSPNWVDGFLSYLPANTNDPRSVMRFFREADRAGLPILPTQRTALVNALVANQFYDESWQYYASFRPQVDRDRSRDPTFKMNVDVPSQFDWSVNNVSGMSASLQRGETGNFFDFSASPSVGGTVLQQLQLLPSGKYRFSGHSTGIEEKERSGPYWVLTCMNGAELGRITVPNSSVNNGNFAGSITVRGDCPAQILSFVVRPSDEISGVSGQFDRIQLEPAS